MTRMNPAAWLAALLMMFLAGCSSLQLEKPQSVEDRVQYAKAGVAAAYRTLGDLIAARSVAPDQGAALFSKLEGVEKQVGLADTLLRAGKPTDALSTVNLALNALTALRAELAARATKGA